MFTETSQLFRVLDNYRNDCELMGKRGKPARETDSIMLFITEGNPMVLFSLSGWL